MPAPPCPRALHRREAVKCPPELRRTTAAVSRRCCAPVDEQCLLLRAHKLCMEEEAKYPPELRRASAAASCGCRVPLDEECLFLHGMVIARGEPPNIHPSERQHGGQPMASSAGSGERCGTSGCRRFHCISRLQGFGFVATGVFKSTSVLGSRLWESLGCQGFTVGEPLAASNNCDRPQQFRQQFRG